MKLSRHDRDQNISKRVTRHWPWFVRYNLVKMLLFIKVHLCSFWVRQLHACFRQSVSHICWYAIDILQFVIALSIIIFSTFISSVRIYQLTIPIVRIYCATSIATIASSDTHFIFILIFLRITHAINQCLLLLFTLIYLRIDFLHQFFEFKISI